MRIAILHLSDIHLTGSSNPVLARLSGIVAALRSALLDVKHCFIAITGDIATTGARGEYDVAERFLENLSRWICEDLRLDSLHLVIVPGNHDCNFLDPSELRQLVLQNMHEYLDNLDPEGEVVTTCLSVQKEFFRFESNATRSANAFPAANRLHYRQVFTVDGYIVRFECFNTAWLSRKQEVQGSLLFPITAITTYDSDSATDLVISCFHHPYGWLQATNHREFQRYIERTSDVVLTGHEHDSEYYLKETRSGDLVQYVEGATLQGPDATQSAFNVLLLDLGTSQQSLITYEWKVDAYERVTEVGPRPFVRNRQLTAGIFENSPAFLQKLTDPGRGFNHPFKKPLQLSDIFVYPDVRQQSLDKLLTGVQRQPTPVKGENLLPYVASKKFILFIGERDAGKTALGKTLYVDLHRFHSLVPVMISGDDIDSLGEFPHSVEKAFSNQYSPLLLERYRQLPLERRALILDDFHLLRLNRKAQRQLIAASRPRFGTILVFADDLFGFEELAAQASHDFNPFADFDHCELRPLGHLLRHRLIRKWVTLGREYVLEEKDIVHETDAKENTVNALIGKNVLPPLPVLILIILQAAEAARGANIISGAYGYFYEVLITEALASVSSDITETGSKYTYLSRVAHHMFKSGRETLSDQEIEEVTRTYADEYRASVEHKTLTAELIQSQVIHRVNGSIRFRYRYYYFYFVARYLKDAIADPAHTVTVREQLFELADHVFFEPYANILVFYLYLTKDIELINYLLEAARTILNECRPCDLEGDIEHFNQLFYAVPRRELTTAGGDATKEEYLEVLDEEVDVHREERTSPETVKYHSGLEVSLKFNIAFKMLQLLGQILKNFPGSLKGQLKLEIAAECYRLGLRALAAFFGLWKEHFEEIRAFIEEVLRDRLRLNPEERMLPSAERIILGLALTAAFGVIKRISYAVGHEQLRLTYEDVMRLERGKLATNPSGVTSKPAIRGHFKTGHRRPTQNT